jgi:hypothetical protein
VNSQTGFIAFNLSFENEISDLEIVIEAEG